jgi:hypothetical protein
MADDQVNTVDQGNTVDQPLLETETPLPPPPMPSPASSPEPESEDDEDVSDEETETETHPVPHMTPNASHVNMLMYAQSFGIQALFWLHTLWTWLSYAADTTQTITKGVVRSLQSKTYIFFKDSNYPYRLQEYATSGPGVPPVDWYYDADKKLFVSSNLYNTNTDGISQHFEWLSGEIKYNGLVLYDVSDYLEDAKWAGVSRPSPARILAGWSLHSGIVLQFVEGLTLHTVNQDGSESVLQLRV